MNISGGAQELLLSNAMVTLSDNARGAFIMMASMTAFTVNDTFMKSLLAELPLFQTMFLRGCATTGLLIVLVYFLSALPSGLGLKDRWLLIARTVMEVASTWFFLSALSHMPLANVSAILQALPLAVTLASAVFLSEPIGWRRLGAITIGFCGVLLIVRPGTEGFTVYSLYALLAVICVTVRDLTARQMSASVPSIVVALAASVGVTLFAGFGAISVEWSPLALSTAFNLLGATVFLVGGYIASVAAMRVGDVGFVAPFRYSSLIVALLLGWLVFGEWPRPVTLIGAALVVGTGIFTFYRERGLAKNRARIPAV